MAVNGNINVNVSFLDKDEQDEVAKWIGVDDRDERITWEYYQIQTVGKAEPFATISVAE